MRSKAIFIVVAVLSFVLACSDDPGDRIPGQWEAMFVDSLKISSGMWDYQYRFVFEFYEDSHFVASWGKRYYLSEDMEKTMSAEERELYKMPIVVRYEEEGTYRLMDKKNLRISDTRDFDGICGISFQGKNNSTLKLDASPTISSSIELEMTRVRGRP